MNVYHLAAVLIRITGLVLILKSIETVVGLAMAGATNIAGQPGFVAFLTFHVMWLTAGVLFLLFPSRIAGNLVPAAPPKTLNQDDIPADALTHLIIIAAGLYFLVDGIKALASLASFWAVYMTQSYGQGLSQTPSFWNTGYTGQVTSGVVSLVAGLWLLLRPVGIARLIHRLRRAHPE